MAKEQSEKVQGQNLNSQAFLTVERESFAAKDGRTMWSYAVHGKGVNGKETKVDFIPIDNGGYEVLEMLQGANLFACKNKFATPTKAAKPFSCLQLNSRKA